MNKYKHWALYYFVKTVNFFMTRMSNYKIGFVLFPRFSLDLYKKERRAMWQGYIKCKTLKE